MASAAEPAPVAKGRATKAIVRSTLVVAAVRGADFLLSFLV